MNLQVIYRLSTNSYKKPKFENATKLHCLFNAGEQFGFDNIHLFVDKTNLGDCGETIMNATANAPLAKYELYEAGSSAGSFKYVWNYVFEQHWSPDTVVYFLEDDYLHLPKSLQVLQEGVARADYVSLYDHNDKYIPVTQGGNPFIDDDGGEVTKVYRTPTTHWKLTNSTTMTFASTMDTLTVDKSVWDKYIQGTHPNDFQIFLDLRDGGRSLITPIPGYSTHCEPMWASPGIDWTKV